MARQARREARQGAFRPGPLLQAVRGRRASWSLHEALTRAEARADRHKAAADEIGRPRLPPSGPGEPSRAAAGGAARVGAEVRLDHREVRLGDDVAAADHPRRDHPAGGRLLQALARHLDAAPAQQVRQHVEADRER